MHSSRAIDIEIDSLLGDTTTGLFLKFDVVVFQIHSTEDDFQPPFLSPNQVMTRASVPGSAKSRTRLRRVAQRRVAPADQCPQGVDRLLALQTAESELGDGQGGSVGDRSLVRFPSGRFRIAVARSGGVHAVVGNNRNTKQDAKELSFSFLTFTSSSDPRWEKARPPWRRNEHRDPHPKITPGAFRIESYSSVLIVHIAVKMQLASFFLSLSCIFLVFQETAGQDVCPHPEDISPCTCSGDPYWTHVRCSLATSIDEIISAFNNVVWPSTTYRSFDLYDNKEIRELPEGVFGKNPVSEVQPGSFNNLRHLQYFNCSSCSLGPTLTAGFFAFNSTFIYQIDLYNNSISMLEPQAISGFGPRADINLYDNKINELTEEAFRPMMEILTGGDGIIDLSGNPVECGCSIAWWVRNPEFNSTLRGQCTDGTDFHDLHPDDFLDCMENGHSS
ncbi:unnamed protein product [Darwinula stevensoni]|uniref:Uncharacterized protein n=1 Tax=Darwinula stevensoni TaxID=69355 RepID=A0A7R9A1U8_9CRUS|nr:unnamed protein product [Darwinula stevensoni]CAG0878619.1 unnamed protein product [Darwinula stevensoni]